jgi:opacity protein-like surface antigen
MTRTCALIAAILLTAFAAAAADPVPLTSIPSGGSGHWSVVTGETVSPDRDVIGLELGWPGASFSYLHGTSDRSDVGIRFDLLYGRENTTNTAFGAGVDVPFRLVVNKSNRVAIGLQIEPGLRIYTQNSQTDFMTRFPVGGVLGVQATPELRVAASAGLTMAVNWTHTAFFEVGPQFGFAAEYAVDRNLLAGLNTRFGPQFYTHTGSTTDLAFTLQIVIGYRM